MQTATLDEIKAVAIRLHDQGLVWHFHILTPGCALNETNRCVFVLEDLDAARAFAYYSDQPQKALGKELSALLHGAKILENTPVDASYVPGEAVKQMVERAQALNKQEATWHHHVLFPQCRFNKHLGQWNLLFEDLQNHITLESSSLAEPVGDLNLIEPLFYAREG